MTKPIATPRGLYKAGPVVIKGRELGGVMFGLFS
jgi:hypothetical protein